MDEDWMPYIGAAIILILVFSSYFLFWRPQGTQENSGKSQADGNGTLSISNCEFAQVDGEEVKIATREACESIDKVTIVDGKYSEYKSDGKPDCKWIKNSCDPDILWG